jgi:DNA-binding transcriptional regulator YiaG
MPPVAASTFLLPVEVAMQDKCVRDSIAQLSDLKLAEDRAIQRFEQARASLGWSLPRTARYLRKGLSTVWRWRHGLAALPGAYVELLWIRAFGAQAGAV